MAEGKELKRKDAEPKLATVPFSGIPRVEMLERDGNLVVRAELPGLEEKDVKVNVEDGSLAISGEQRSEHEETREGFYSSSRRYTSFQRRVPLPDDVEASSCEVSFRDGLLEVTLKKRH